MAKKIISVLSLCLSLCILLSGQAYAAVPENQEVSSHTEILEDGTSITTSVYENTISVRGSSKSGSKTVTVKNADGDILWTFTVHAKFNYNNSFSVCTEVSHSYSIKNSDWKLGSASSSRSGSTATGNVSMKQYFFGIVAQTINRTVTLTCSANGTLS